MKNSIRTKARTRTNGNAEVTATEWAAIDAAREWLRREWARCDAAFGVSADFTKRREALACEWAAVDEDLGRVATAVAS